MPSHEKKKKKKKKKFTQVYDTLQQLYIFATTNLHGIMF